MNTTGQIGVMECRRNKIALLYILCTGYDLYRLVLSDIYLAYPHMVRVFVANNRQYLGGETFSIDDEDEDDFSIDNFNVDLGDEFDE